MQAELFAPSQGRILVVDDTAANIQAVTAILREHGYQISVATNGRQAFIVRGAYGRPTGCAGATLT